MIVMVLYYYRGFLPIDSNRRIIIKHHNFESANSVFLRASLKSIIYPPYCLILFINDLPNVIQHSQLFLFADDAKVFNIIQDAINLQNDLNNLEKWPVNNCLTLSIIHSNKKKKNSFNQLIFGSTLTVVANSMYLGVIFDTKLNFSNHTETIKHEATQNLSKERIVRLMIQKH